jgi:hypothetical protein
MPRDNDALSLLKKDHEDEKKLFKEIEAEEDQEAIFQSDPTVCVIWFLTAKTSFSSPS